MNIGDRVPAGEDFLVRRLQELERKVARMESARTLDLATITAEPGLGIRTGDFDGTDFAHPGTAGNYFGGDGAVLNALKLRPGSLDNDALVNPLVIGQGNNASTGFSIGTAETTLVTINLTVPAGFTGFSCMAIGGLSAINPTASLDYLYARVLIDAFYGDTLWSPASGGNGSTSLTVFKQGQLTGLTTGGTVAITLRAHTQGAAWAANAANIASLNLLAFWLR